MKKLFLILFFFFYFTYFVSAACPAGTIFYLDGESISDKSSNNFKIVSKGVNLQGGLFNKAYSFGGTSSSYLEIPKEVLNNKKKFTVSFWVKSSGSQGAFLSVVANKIDNYFVFGDLSGLSVYLNANKKIYDKIKINDNSWHHLALMFNSVQGELKIYLDGVIIQSAEIDKKNMINGHKAFIGQNPNFVTAVMKKGILLTAAQKKQSFKGLIDDFIIFNNALSDEEVYSIYSKTGSICEGNNSIDIIDNSELTGTSEADIFQIYDDHVWINGLDAGEVSEGTTLNGGDGDDIFVSVGSESQIIIGGAGNDNYWIDSTDRVFDPESGEEINRISAYYQPWTNNKLQLDYVSLESKNNQLKDPNFYSPYVQGISLQRFSFPLFDGEPKYSDIKQGVIGDCYYLAVLASFAEARSEVIKKSIVPIGDGTYIVRFYRSSQPVYLKIDGDLPAIREGVLVYANFGENNSLWVPLLEKSYAFFRFGMNSYGSLNGGWMSSVISELTNNPSTTQFTRLISGNKLFSDMLRDLQEHQSVTTGSYGQPGDPIVGGHAYMIKEVFESSENLEKRFVVYNPWGIDGISWDDNELDGLLELEFNRLSKQFSAVVSSDL